MPYHIQARNVQFKPIHDYRPEYEERILLVCENPNLTTKDSHKKAVSAPSRVIRIGQLMHTGKNGHLFHFEDDRSESIGLGNYNRIVAWAQMPDLNAFTSTDYPETDEDLE